VDAPVVAASANRAGAAPPRSAEEAVAALDGEVTLVLDGGMTRYAKASTVVRLEDDGFRVLRAGVIDERFVRRYGSLNIVFVCSGNTCRSPMAEAMLKAMLAERLDCSRDELAARDIYVRSAGAASFGGSPASEGAINAMRRRGLDISRHSAAELNPELIQQADYIFGMTRSHVDAVLSLVPSAADRTALIAEDEEIDDPYGGPDERYEACAATIEKALKRRVQEIMA
jgi:protein-tyrosine phosphatase